MYKSDKVALVVCGVGVASIFVAMAVSCAEERDEPVPTVVAGTRYANNSHVSGAGWYHASSGRFFPYQYNHYNPAYGYYHDGIWSHSPGTAVPASSLSSTGAEEANGAIVSSHASGSGGGGSKSAVSSSSSKSGSSRGGFGSTGGGSGS